MEMMNGKNQIKRNELNRINRMQDRLDNSIEAEQAIGCR
jgi:hypothetical protein